MKIKVGNCYKRLNIDENAFAIVTNYDENLITYRYINGRYKHTRVDISREKFKIIFKPANYYQSSLYKEINS